MTLAAASAVEGPLAERPLLAPWLRRAEVDGRLVLEYGDEIVVLGGERALALLEGLLPLLDGTRTTADAAAEIGVRAAVAEATVAELRRHGLVVDGLPADDAATLCAALSGRVSPADAQARLDAASVAVVGASACAEELARLLDATIGEVADVEWDDALDVDLAVAAPAPVELPELERWNERLLERRQPWLQVLPFNGRLAAVGPLFLPGETCCQACFEHRRAAALGEPTLLRRLGRAPASYPEPLPLAAALAGLASTLLVRWLGSSDAALPGVLFALELEDGLRLDAHRVLRVPRCPACSPTVRLAAPLPWTGP